MLSKAIFIIQLRLRKEINRLLSKDMSNIYFKVTIETFSKLRFSAFKSITRSIFRELQLTQISLNFKTSCCNLKIRGLGVRLFVCVWLFYYFHFERNFDVLKWKRPCNFLNKNINLNKNKTESKMENPTQSFRETKLVPQLIQESQIKSKTVISWSSWNKKEGIFCIVYFIRRGVF